MTFATLIKTTFIRLSFIILFCISTKFNAQTTTEKELIVKMEKVYKQKNGNQLDSIYNSMKKQALALGLDSLYIELTFYQIEKNGGLQLYPNSELLLENLLTNKKII